MATEDNSECVLKTKNGSIRGRLQDDDKPYYIFGTIPYAKPPLKQLRFLAPISIQPWNDILNCTNLFTTPTCENTNDQEHAYSSYEDCLYIDIFTPNIHPKKPLPVMFWIGCFVYSCSLNSILDSKIIIDQDVIFVRCSFRMGPFGFLSINDFTAPGNCGLKDIVMALKWVQENISVFGGDPNNVTIFGNSSGGAIVHLMMLSPMATGLFHKAIIQSGSALNNWSLAKNPSLPALELAKTLGINVSDKVEAIEVMRTFSTKDIVKAFQKLCVDLCQNGDGNAFDAFFKPSIEDEFEGQPAFLTKSPVIIIKSGNFNKVPLIIGSNNVEGELLPSINKDLYNFDKYNKNVRLLVPQALAGESNKSRNIGLQLIKFYTGEETLREETSSQYLQLLTDYYFVYYVNKTVRLHAQYAPEFPVYYYVLNHTGEWLLPSEYECFNNVGHCCELAYIFKLKLPNCEEIIGSRDTMLTRSKVIALWTNFAKYGNPTPEDYHPLLQITWDPIEDKDKLNYLSIGPDLTKGRNPFSERMLFWDNIHNEHSFQRVLVHFNALGVVW